MSEYNVIAELPIRNIDAEQASTIVDRLSQFHPVVATSPLGWAEVTITVHAETVAQAVAVAAGLIGNVVSVTAMLTEEFDRRPVGVDRLPDLVSVTEASERLGVSRQAVLQRLERGTLAGSRVGSTWVVPAAALS